MRKGVVLLLLLMFPLVSLAQTQEPKEVELEEIVVTATRIPTPEEKVGSAISVITEEEIKTKGYTTVKDVLKGELGLDVVSTGGPGAQSSVFIRGLESYHTLVMIDGVLVGDPSLMQRQFNFANLTVDNIERIEIVRGPQSVLYGSDAIGGVINIITKKGKGKPSLYAGLEGGSYDTFRQFGGVSGEIGKASFSLGLSHTKTHGFSAADEDLPGNEEEDGWENLSLSGRLDFEPTSWLALGSTLRFQKGDTDLDQGGGPYRDIKDYHVEHEMFAFRPHLKMDLIEGKWKQEIAMGIVGHKRDYLGDPWGDSSYWGRIYQLSWQNELKLMPFNSLIVGLDYLKEEMESSSPWSQMAESAWTFSLYVEDQLNLYDFSFTTLGVRWDRHKEFGDHTTLRATQAFWIEKTGTKIRGSIGTGFRAPSLYELYAPPFWGPVGNPELDPEKSIGWDVGIEQKVLGFMGFGVTYFRNEVEDLIDYVYGKGYINVEEAKSSGVEGFLQLYPLKDVTAKLTYTYTETEDDEGKRLLRRPLNKVGISIGYSFCQERGNIGAHILWVDDRWDYNWSIRKRVKLDDYTVVNLSGSFKVHKNLEVFARVENLFDEDYEEAYGYGTPGFSVYGGIKAVF